MDVDEGYSWIGGAEVALTQTWQHFAMEPIYTAAAQRGHEIQIAFLLGLKVGGSQTARRAPCAPAGLAHLLGRACCMAPWAWSRRGGAHLVDRACCMAPWAWSRRGGTPMRFAWRAAVSHASRACHTHVHAHVAPHGRAPPTASQVAEFAFDDIELYELDVLSPPPPSPPPPPNYVLWLDGEGGPNRVQTVIAADAAGKKGHLRSDLSSTDAAKEGRYGFEVTVDDVFEINWCAERRSCRVRSACRSRSMPCACRAHGVRVACIVPCACRARSVPCSMDPWTPPRSTDGHAPRSVCMAACALPTPRILA